MGRASLLSLLREKVQVHSQTSTTETHRNKLRQDLTNLSVDAAKATIQLVLVLKQHNLLCRFSYTDHQPTASALIILLLDSVLKRRLDTAGIIEDGIDTLRFMASDGCRGAKSDLVTVEQLRNIVTSLRQRIYQTDIINSSIRDPKAAETSSSEAYQAWVNWITELDKSDNAVEKSSLPDTQRSIPGLSTGRNIMTMSFQDALYFDPLYGASGSGVEAEYGFEWDNGRLNMTDILEY